MNNNVAIQFHPDACKKERLTEAGQTLKVEFAWLQKLDADTYESQTPWMLCRDYFNEIWQRCYYGNTVKPKVAYGFKIDNLDVRGERDEGIYLAISWKKLDYNPLEFFKQWLYTFNKIEEANGFYPTQVDGVNEVENFFVIKSSRQWMDNPTLLGILTLSLRMMCYEGMVYDTHPYEQVQSLNSDNTDRRLVVEQLKPYAKNKHVEVLKAIFYNFSMWAEMNQKHLSLTTGQLSQQDSAYDGYTLHNGSGFVSVIQRCLYFNTHKSEFKDKLLKQTEVPMKEAA